MSVLEKLPYEVRRQWPPGWDLLPALLGKPGGEAGLEAPARYLHPSLEVRLVPGRGRGVVATAPVEAGELVLLDSPLIAAEAHEALVGAVRKRCQDDKEFRSQVLSMCGDPADEEARGSADAAPSEELVRNILRHNYHAVERAPVDGELASGGVGVVGLWPLGSLINHSLRPNVARSFAGNANCYRTVRPLQTGDEVLDNYLDLRLPRALRQEMLRKNHGLTDEGPDEFDAGLEVMAEIRSKHEDIKSEILAGTRQATQAGFRALAELTNLCVQTGKNDPAFADIFRDFAIAAGQLGDANYCLEGLAQGIECATSREPYSMISLVLALRMVHMACLAKDEVDAEAREGLEAVAREHFRMIYGPYPAAFDGLNKKLVRMLAEMTPKEAAADPAPEGEAKRQRKE